MTHVFQLAEATVLDLIGADAPAILHNLTTNEVKSLEVGCGCETFITDVRGKTLAHVYAFRTPDGYRLIGAAGQASVIAAHADRYIIREDAETLDQSSSLQLFVISPDASSAVRDETDWGSLGAVGLCTDWLGGETLVLVCDDAERVKERLHSVGETVGNESAFHQCRVMCGFPWYGVDLTEKNLPQEASRIEDSISFVKGCYLGQETVARLDALGQVQKQLVRWNTQGVIPKPGSEVSSDGKVVGRLTSVAPTSESTAIAIGIARRTHFDAGSEANGDGFTATVL